MDEINNIYSIVNTQRNIRQTGIIENSLLSNTSIVIIGAGAIGSWTALALAKIGFLRINVTDGDKVEVHNTASQFYSDADQEQFKTEALQTNIEIVTGVKIAPYNFFIDEKTGFLDCDFSKHSFFISGVDNMKARKDLFTIFKKHKKDKDITFIDGRMGRNELQVYVVRTDGEIVKYEKLLFTDEQADDVPCSEQSVAYNGLIIAGIISAQVIKVLSNKPYKFETIVDLENFMMM